MRQDGMRDLTMQMRKKDESIIPLQLRQAVVTAITGDTLTVTLDGTSITGVRKLASYAPMVNDSVWLFQNGGDLIVLSNLGGGGARTISYQEVTVPPLDYPSGHSVFSIDAHTGWPDTYSTVETVMPAGTPWRAVQTITSKNTGKQWRRTATGSGDGWSAWQQAAIHEDSGWLEITAFYNGATAYQTGLTGVWTPRYRKINGIVYLQGLINTNATTNPIHVATLPAGYRPRSNHMGIQMTTSAYYRRMDVGSDGAIWFREGNAYTTGWHSITAQFPAEA